ncbi:MAG: hypothetical protein IJX26_02855, partial [Clostridia bacterium]|nr:hypothetical protein [Clostridia bacterium]
VIATCGFVVGCGDKYKDLKVTTNLSEPKLTLYVGEEGADSSTIIFSVDGADGTSTALKFSFEKNEEGRVVQIVDEVREGNKTSVTVKAIAGGETTLVALTEEGNKKATVNISSIIRAESMEMNTAYKPAVLTGDSLVLDTTKIVFDPSNTTQNKVKYSLDGVYAGVTLTESGLLEVAEDATVTSVKVNVTNLDNSSLQTSFDVKVIKKLTADDVQIKNSQNEDITELNLAINGGAESVADVFVYVNTIEEYKTSFSSRYIDDTDMAEDGIVRLEDEQIVNKIKVIASNAGKCYLKVSIVLPEYNNMEMFAVNIPVNVFELPSAIAVNGNEQDYAVDIYTKYNNNLGTEFSAVVGSESAETTDYIVALSEEQASHITIVKADKSVVKPLILGTNNEDYDVLKSGTKIYVTGNTINRTVNLQFIALGSYGRQNEVVLNVTLNILLGAETLAPIYVSQDIREKTVFVEQGQSVILNYTTNENASTKGIRVDSRDLDKTFSTEIENVEGAEIITTGLKVGVSSACLVLSNGVTSENFIIFVFKTIDDIYTSVDSPLANSNIAEANYSFGKLTDFVMSLGVGVNVNY